MTASRARTIVIIAVLALLAWLFAPAAYYRLFSTFNWWDDEGYLMISIANHARGLALYDSVSSQYGPFYYLASWAALHLPGVQLDHAWVRFFVEGLWLASALFGAGFVYRCTWNLPAAALTFVFLALHLRGLSSEPGHPQGLLVLLLFGSAFLCGFARESIPRGFVPVLGAAAAAMFLTKINVGVFFVVSSALVLLAFTQLAGRARIVQPLAWLAALILPAALMRDHLGDRARAYCILVVATIACVGAVLLFSRRAAHLRPRALLVFGLWFVFAGSLVSAFVLLRGTSVGGLLDGVILRPLGTARIYYTGSGIVTGELVWSAASVVLAVVHLVLIRSGARAASVDGALLVLIRIAFGWVVFERALAGDAHGMLVRAAPFLWVTLLAPTPRGALPVCIEPARAFLAAIAMLQTMQAYPVSGTQQVWSTMLLLPAAAVSLADAVSILARPIERLLPARLWTAIRWSAAAACIAVAIGMCWGEKAKTQAEFASKIRLALPGTGALRLREDECATYRWLTANLPETTFYSLPALNSLYFWTGANSPTTRNYSFGWFFHTPREQHELIEQLEGLPDLVSVFVDRQDYFPPVQSDGSNWPILEYIEKRFVPVARVGVYELRVRDGKALATTFRARLQDGGISLEIPALATRALHGIIIAPANAAPYFGDLYCLTEKLRRITGKPELSMNQRMDSPIDLSRPSRIDIPCTGDDEKRILAARFPVARLYDVDGKVIASLPFERP